MENELNQGIECSHCGECHDSNDKPFTDSDMTKINDGDLVCSACLSENYTKCDETEEYYNNDEMTIGYKLTSNGTKLTLNVNIDDNNYILCSDSEEFWHINDCIEIRKSGYRESLGTRFISKESYESGNYFKCGDCGEFFEDDNGSYIEGHGHSVCEGCLENYSYCEPCGNYYYSADGESCCESDNEECGIHSYSFKPVPKFRGKKAIKNPFIGFELEIECKDNSKLDLAQTVDDEYLYKKEDGSLHNGFEIVSHPSTLEIHQKENYKQLFESLSKRGGKSHDTTTCGLHFHLDRSKMSEGHKVRLGMLLAFCAGEFQLLARRAESSYAKYKKTHENMENYENDDRYSALNWQNTATVEFRIFKGTLKYETFMASMELCHAAYNFTHGKNCFGNAPTVDNDVIFKKFLTFIGQTKKVNYNHLVTYIESKNFKVGA